MRFWWRDLFCPRFKMLPLTSRGYVPNGHVTMPTTSALKPSDARKSERRASNAPGMVHYDSTSIPCHLVDISSSGAVLLFASSPTIPQVFVLTVPDENLHRRCGIVWRRGVRMGVQFF